MKTDTLEEILERMVTKHPDDPDVLLIARYVRAQEARRRQEPSLKEAVSAIQAMTASCPEAEAWIERVNDGLKELSYCRDAKRALWLELENVMAETMDPACVTPAAWESARIALNRYRADHWDD